MVESKKKAGPLTLHQVLEAHNRCSDQKNTAPQALGDGYLYKNSQVFRSVREAFLGLGYRFEMQLSFPYSSFPLLALTEILDQKIVPITNNVYYLKKLETKLPRLLKMHEINFVGPTSNYLFHESCHCIAHHILGGPPEPTWTYHVSSERADLVKIMLGESFANASEFITASLMELRN